MKSYDIIGKPLMGLTLALASFGATPGAMAAPVVPADVQKMVAEADTAYAKGDYEKTISLYTGIIEQTGPSASLLYNLGNAYQKSGNEGEARLCMERAKRYDPSNKDIDQNIDYIAMRVSDANQAELKGKKGDVMPDDPGFFDRANRSISVDTSSNAWAEMAATAFVLLILALALYFFSSNVRFKKIGFFSAIIFLFFSVVFVAFSEMAASHFRSRDEAVLMQFKLTLSSEPLADAPEVGFPLHRGTKFRILDSELGADGEVEWYKVELNHSNIGWVPAGAIEII